MYNRENDIKVAEVLGWDVFFENDEWYCRKANGTTTVVPYFYRSVEDIFADNSVQAWLDSNYLRIDLHYYKKQWNAVINRIEKKEPLFLGTNSFASGQGSSVQEAICEALLDI